jgi:hypothetical protein
MPYVNTRRLYNIFGKKVFKYLQYKRAKRIFNEINRDMAFIESKFVKSKLGHI